MQAATSRRISLKISSAIYQQWASIDPAYRKCLDGCDVELDYFDSGLEPEPNTQSCVKQFTVLLLHGIGGTWRDWWELIETLKPYKYRLICPDLPSYNLKEPKNCKSTPLEIATFVALLLTNLQIKSIDVVISHSGATYLLPHLSLDIKFKSYMLLCSSTHEQSHKTKGVKAFTFYHTYRLLRTNRLGRFMATKVGCPLMALTLGVSLANPDAGYMAYKCGNAVDKVQLIRFLTHIKDTKTPCVVMFPEDDSVISARSNHEFIQILGSTYENVSIYDHNDLLVKRRTVDDYPFVFVLKSGGHLFFQRKPQLVGPILSNLLRRLEERSNPGQK